MFNLRVNVHLLLSHLVILQIISLITLLLFDLERPNSAGNTCGRRAYYQGSATSPLQVGSASAFPSFFQDSITRTPFVVKYSNIINIRGKLVTVTPSSQGAVLQLSPIFGFPSIYVYNVRRLERPNSAGNIKGRGLYQVSPPFRGSWLQGTPISGNGV